MLHVHNDKDIAIINQYEVTQVPQQFTKSIKVPSSVLGTMPKSDLQKRDILGRTILHLLILINRYDILKRLFKNPEAKSILLLADYENGWNCLHYAIYYKRLQCFRAIMEHLKIYNTVATTHLSPSNNSMFLELLRCKDRTRLTPFQLLDNDFKDLMWVPRCIKHDHYELEYRWNDKSFHKSSIKCDVDWWSSMRGGSDIIVFGSNQRFNLGIGKASAKSVPEKLGLEYFQIRDFLTDGDIQKIFEKPRFLDIKIRKYHSIVLTKSKHLFSCGVGTKGRLGHGDTKDSYTFRKINSIDSKIYYFDASDLHTIAISADNKIYGWGANNFCQLGYNSSLGISDTNEDFISEPYRIWSKEFKNCTNNYKGVAVSSIHSIVYSDSDIYFWGLNIGQIAMKMEKNDLSSDHRIKGILYKGKIQETVRKFSMRDKIKLVSTCETCTVVVTADHDIHVHFQGQHIKLPKIPSMCSTDKHFDIFKPGIMTKAITIKKVVVKHHNLICFLLSNGDVKSLCLNEGEQYSKGAARNLKYSSVWKAHNHDMTAVDLDISIEGSIILCTRNGSTFIKVASKSSSTSNQRKISMTETTSVIPSRSKFKKLDNLNKICRLSCDNDFESFGFIKDEIDMLPGQITQNKIMTDMAYLHVLHSSNNYRKQSELLIENSDFNSYETDFFYPCKTRVNEDEISLEDDDYEIKSSNEEVDAFISRRNTKFLHKKSESMIQRHYSEVSSTLTAHIELKLRTLDDKTLVESLSTSADKFYDCQIYLEKLDVYIGVHKYILRARSTFCAKLFNSGADNIFIHDDIEGNYDAAKEVINFKSNINLRSLLILLYFIYSNVELNIWESFPRGEDCPSHIKQVRQSYRKLVHLFRLDSVYGHPSNNSEYLKDIKSIKDNHEDNHDIIIKLKDGQVKCFSGILIARSAYFETLLSNRWTDKGIKTITFNEMKVIHFEIILQFLLGDVNELFATNSFKDLSQSDEFVNLLLEIIEISDELLIFDLKDYCQIAIKDFIDTENVFVILMHADTLKASNLFLNCCWFIYNNLEVLLLDPSLKDIPIDLIAKLETQLEFLDNCKQIDFFGENCEFKSFNNNYVNDGNIMITDFLNDIQKFNSDFIQGFEPLYDLPKEVRHKKKSKPTRSSSTIATESVLTFRNSFHHNTSSLSSATSSAIEDNQENFIPVLNQRRRKSSKINVLETEFKAETSHTQTTKPCSQSIQGNTPISIIKTEKLQSTCNLPSEIRSQPILSKAKTDTDKKSSRIKSAPRLSQKERKKQALKLESESSSSFTTKNTLSLSGSDSSLTSPWNCPSPGSSSNSTRNNSYTWGENLPVLGQDKFKTKGENASNGLSLAAIMIQESLKTEDTGCSQRRTLQEIQQEQEFAKWWEEEAARVQKNLMGSSCNSNSDKNNNGNSKSKSKSKCKSKKFRKKTATKANSTD